MSDTRTFTWQTEGLSYTVTVYTDENGQIMADITVNEGFADINGLYWGDDTMEGKSASLGGSLNMNGSGSTLDGETVQWDDAQMLSKPGLGPAGTEKPTFLQAGDTLTVQLDATSLDDIDFFGIRATSTSTPEGSIKGVSEAEPEDECVRPEVGTYPELPDDVTGITFGIDQDGDPETYENYIYVAREEVTDPGDTLEFDDYFNVLLTKMDELEIDCEADPLKAFIYRPDDQIDYLKFDATSETWLPFLVPDQQAPVESFEDEEPVPEMELA
jgi:hypothetical protein